MDDSSDDDDMLALYADEGSRDRPASTGSSLSSELTVRFGLSSGEEEETTTTPFPDIPNATAFDLELPVKHTYLGNDLEELSGRTLLEDGSYHTLPILPQPGIVLVPGQTIPMTLFHSLHIKMMQNCIAKDRTFGLVCLRFVNNKPNLLSNIGTTAEIYEFQEMESGTAQPLQAGFRIKAKGRQRFRILSTSRTSYGSHCAKVVILSERVLPDLLGEIRPPSMKRPFQSLKKRDMLSRRDAMMTRWPYWIHAQYETRQLVIRIKRHLEHLDTEYGGHSQKIPTDPIELSFWVAQTLPLEEDQRLLLLTFDSAIQRLRWELNLLEKCRVFCCRNCSYKIALQRNVFSMSLEGPQNMYVNSGGYLHETLTLRSATGLLKQSVEPSTECSWFPGYAWTILECDRCREHMGWLFTAVSPNLKPKEFYGLTRRSLTVKLTVEELE